MRWPLSVFSACFQFWAVRGLVLTRERWVQTDMGNSGVRSLGIEKAEVDLEVAVRGTAKVARAGMIRLSQAASRF